MKVISFTSARMKNTTFLKVICLIEAMIILAGVAYILNTKKDGGAFSASTNQTPEFTCDETDGGNDPFHFGTLNWVDDLSETPFSETYEDTCRYNVPYGLPIPFTFVDLLEEWYCEDGEMKQAAHICEHGCVQSSDGEGKCIFSPGLLGGDADGGTDSGTGDDDGDGGADGTSVPEACTDTDNPDQTKSIEEEYEEQGTLTKTYSNGMTMTKTDSCVTTNGGTTIFGDTCEDGEVCEAKEWYCNGVIAESVTHECESGQCLDGICVPQLPTSCEDPDSSPQAPPIIFDSGTEHLSPGFALRSDSLQTTTVTLLDQFGNAIFLEPFDEDFPDIRDRDRCIHATPSEDGDGGLDSTPTLLCSNPGDNATFSCWVMEAACAENEFGELSVVFHAYNCPYGCLGGSCLSETTDGNASADAAGTDPAADGGY